MINFIKKLFNKSKKVKKVYQHFACVVKKDKSGRRRHKVYIDGKLAKTELTIDGWIPIKPEEEKNFV